MRRPFLDHWRDDLRAIATALDTHGSRDRGDARPIPPPELIRRVNSAEKADAAVFLRSGVSDLQAIVETLADAVESRTRDREPPFPAHPTIMELGCGLGRLLRHAPDPALAHVIATDVNAGSLDWCRAHLLNVDYHLHGPLPPIASLPAASIDVVYAHSVFTHVPLEHQTVWLRELARLLRPAGWLAITCLGHVQQEALLNEEEQAILRTTGAIQIRPEYMPGHDDPVMYGAVCQTVADQEATVGAVFDIVRRRERHARQDVVVARRRVRESHG